MPGLPIDAAMSAAGRRLHGRYRAVADRNLIEQSVAERLARAAIASALLWLGSSGFGSYIR